METNYHKILGYQSFQWVGLSEPIFRPTFFGSDCTVSGIEKQLSTWGTKVTGSGHESLSQDGMSESDCHKD
jgi:hypothetical protein